MIYYNLTYYTIMHDIICRDKTEHIYTIRCYHMVHPVSITRFPLSRFSPGAGLLRNPFFYTINAKIFQGLGPKRRESCYGDRVCNMPCGPAAVTATAPSPSWVRGRQRGPSASCLYMYVCVCVYIYIYIYIDVYVYVYVYV